MTKEEILELAREAGFDEHHAKFDTRIERFSKLIAEKEFKSGFLAGWYESGEGFNSECGCSIRTVLEMCDEAFKTRG